MIRICFLSVVFAGCAVAPKAPFVASSLDHKTHHRVARASKTRDFCLGLAPVPWGAFSKAYQSSEATIRPFPVNLMPLDETISLYIKLSRTDSYAAPVPVDDTWHLFSQIDDKNSDFKKNGDILRGPASSFLAGCEPHGPGINLINDKPVGPDDGYVTRLSVYDWAHWGSTQIAIANISAPPAYKFNIAAHQAGTMSAPGDEVPANQEVDARFLRLAVNNDDDNGDGRFDNSDERITPQDNDIVKIVLHKPTEPGVGETNNPLGALKIKLQIIDGAENIRLLRPVGQCSINRLRSRLERSGNRTARRAPHCG